MAIKKAIITAAGFGTRFLPITKTWPKEMLPIVNKPIIHWVVDECAEAGIEEIIIVASPPDVTKYEDYFYGRATTVRTLLIRQNKLDRWSKVEQIFKLPDITVIPQDDRLPYGNGTPILSAKTLLQNEDEFFMCYGDDLVLSDISAVKQVVDFYNANPCDGVIAAQLVADSEVYRYGLLEIKPGTKNQVIGVTEKPEVGNQPSNLANYGRYILTPEIFDYLKPNVVGADGEIWLVEAFDHIMKKKKVLTTEVDGTWYTTGDPKNYLIAQNAFSEYYNYNGNGK